jgi:hypothetical protein
MNHAEEPDLNDPDNPEWTDSDFKRAISASSIHAPEVARLLVSETNRRAVGLANTIIGQRVFARTEKLAA